MKGRVLGDRKPAWLDLPEVNRLFAVLDPSFQEMRFVGGCVRNHLLQLPVKDFDLATTLLPDEVIALLEKASLKTVPLGLKHGTVLAVIHQFSFEITTLRHDLETDGRHAVVSYTTDWQEDAARRDFTFNALYLSKEGELYDPWQGEKDLSLGIVRFIGHAEARVQEDYLRILRYFRFQAQYGQNNHDSDALKACQTFAAEIKRLSAERVQSELIKLLEASDPVPALQSMIDTQVWPFVWDPVSSSCLSLLQRLIQKEREYSLEPFSERRLAILLSHESLEKRKSFLEKLKFSRQRQKMVENIVLASQSVCQSLHELLYKYGYESTYHALLLQMAHGYHSFMWEQLPNQWIKPLFPLKGEMLLDLGIVPGPVLGKILHHVEQWWVKQDFEPTLQSCLVEARAYAKKIQKDT